MAKKVRGAKEMNERGLEAGEGAFPPRTIA